VPFGLSVPWRCPITGIDGRPLGGMRVGLRTRIDVPGPVDPGDLDPVTVLPLPVRHSVLLAPDGLGFALRGADEERPRPQPARRAAAEPGEEARLFMALSNTGGEPVMLTDISGPDFGGVRVETTEGQGLPRTVDAQDNLYVGAEGPPNVTLLDLGRELRSSQSIPVTFTFDDAGEVTVDVPVSAEGQTPTPPFDFLDDDPDQEPAEDGTSTSPPST
jgi:copper(I)-binding protein